MNNRPCSYTEWLETQGVRGRNENTNSSGTIRKEANINFLFETENAAAIFAQKFSISVHESRQSYPHEEQIVFRDPVEGHYAVLVTFTDRGKMEWAYQKEQEEKLVDREKIKEQLALIEERLTLLEQNPKSGIKEHVQSSLDTAYKLARNEYEEGWFSPEATDAIYYSIENYIALNMNALSDAEIASLKQTATEIKERIKPDAHWLRFLTTTPMDEKRIREDAEDLLHGKKNRKVVNSMEEWLNEKREGEEKSEETEIRKIPRFFPDSTGTSETDYIYIDAGGRSDHRTIIKIWKKSVDKNGTPTPAYQKPHHYEYYQTEYNAGSGIEWAEAPVPNKVTKTDTTGVGWVISTKRILPNWKCNKENGQGKKLEALEQPNPSINVHEYNEIMEDTLKNLIISQRMIKHYKKPSGFNVAGDVSNASPEPEEAEKWRKYKNQIDSHLSPRIDELSEKGPPQLSSNCVVMSLELVLKKEVRAEHWVFLKENNAQNTINELTSKQHTLIQTQAEEASKQRKENPSELFQAIQTADLDKVKEILIKSPELINIHNTLSEYTLLISAIVHYSDARGNLEQQTKYLAIINFLFSRNSIDINLQDKDGDTALHRAAFYAGKHNDKILQGIAEQLILQGAKLDIQNKCQSKDTPRTLIEEQGVSELGLFLKQHEEGNNAPEEKKDEDSQAFHFDIPRSLTRALMSENTAEVKKLIENKRNLLTADVNQQQMNLLICSIMFASRKGIQPDLRNSWLDFAQWLLVQPEIAAVLNKSDGQGTALDYAAYAAYLAYAYAPLDSKNPYEAICEKLIVKGADAEIQDKFGNTAVDWIQEVPNLKALYEIMKKIKQDLNSLDCSLELKKAILRNLNNFANQEGGSVKEKIETRFSELQQTHLILPENCPPELKKIFEHSLNKIVESPNFDMLKIKNFQEVAPLLKDVYLAFNKIGANNQKDDMPERVKEYAKNLSNELNNDLKKFLDQGTFDQHSINEFAQKEKTTLIDAQKNSQLNRYNGCERAINHALRAICLLGMGLLVLAEHALHTSQRRGQGRWFLSNKYPLPSVEKANEQIEKLRKRRGA